jgi:hypothetical protein
VQVSHYSFMTLTKPKVTKFMYARFRVSAFGATKIEKNSDLTNIDLTMSFSIQIDFCTYLHKFRNLSFHLAVIFFLCSQRLNYKDIIKTNVRRTLCAPCRSTDNRQTLLHQDDKCGRAALREAQDNLVCLRIATFYRFG